MAEARAIIQRHRDEAELARLFHKATGPRLQNVEACIAACKVRADEILREIDGLASQARE